MKEIKKQHEQRVLLSRAQVFVRENLGQKIILEDMAKASGFSPYHFIRVFNAYFGETPFSYIRRMKLLEALRKLDFDGKSIIHIALDLGFESPSSFNKFFKKNLNLSPTEFRNLGKDEKEAFLYDFSMSLKEKEKIMQLRMDEKPEIIEREETIIFSLKAKDKGNFKEIAPGTWDEFIPILLNSKQDVSESEFLGLSSISFNSEKEEEHLYKAAISVPKGKELQFKELIKENLPKARYAKFLLKGSYLGVWPAFDKAFKILNESELELAEGDCLENYLNDPNQTPEEELLTEILIPIK